MYKVYSIYDIFKDFYDAGLPNEPADWQAEFRIAVPYTYYDGETTKQNIFQIMQGDIIDELLMNYERFAFKVGYNRAPFEHFLNTWIRYRDTFLDYNLPQILSAYLSKYNPLDNYDGYEKEDTGGHTRNHKSGTIGTNNGQTVSNTQTPETKHFETTYDSSTDVLKWRETNTASVQSFQGGGSTNFGTLSLKNPEDVYSDVNVATTDTHVQDFTDAKGERTVHKHGNMGVRTTSEMIELELNTRKFDILKYIIQNFINKYFFPY